MHLKGMKWRKVLKVLVGRKKRLFFLASTGVQWTLGLAWECG